MEANPRVDVDDFFEESIEALIVPLSISDMSPLR